MQMTNLNQVDPIDSLHGLRRRRFDVVQAQITAENQHDFVGVIAAFHQHHPRYEVIPFATGADGADAMRVLLQALTSGFPNLYTEIFATHHAEDSVIVEGQLVGTHMGSWLDLPPSHRVINVPCVAIFLFDEDRLLRKRLYFDSGTLTNQVTLHHTPGEERK